MFKDIIPHLPVVAACLTIALGALGLLNPNGAQRLVGVRASGPEGISEIRATYGGFFLALGVLALTEQKALIFMTVGIAWWGAAAARFLSFFIDSVWTPRNLGALLFEAAIGAGFLSSRIASWL